MHSLFDAGLDASWELDLWGGVARSLEASDARAQAAAVRAEDMRLRGLLPTSRVKWRRHAIRSG